MRNKKEDSKLVYSTDGGNLCGVCGRKLAKYRCSDDNAPVTDGIVRLQRQVKGRIAYFLIFLSDHIYSSRTFRLPVTRREIGELISMTTENTIRTLSEFRQDGIISMEGKSLKILDYKRLEGVSNTG